MSNRVIEAILRLSAKLGNMDAFKKVSDNLARVDNQAKAYNRTNSLMVKGLDRMLAYAAPAAIAAMGVTSAKAFAQIERRMERIGITAEASAEKTTAAYGRVKEIADDLKVPIDSVLEGLESLVASGKSLDEALAFLPSVAGTAHAADAAFGDMATTADAIGSSLGIAANRMEEAFDIIAKGGKAGKFELKDMAAELPSLAPAFAALGYRGEEGLKRLTAALQTVRLETGSSSEAATSFMDVLTKMESETVSNNFKKFGVDIRSEMAKARKAGEDTLEAFIRLSTKAVKGDLSKLPQLFTDKQMLIGMRALMNHTQEFAGFMKELGDAAGTVRTDLKRLADDAQGDFDRLKNSWDRLQQSIGKAVVQGGGAAAMDAAAAALDAKAEAGERSDAAWKTIQKEGFDIRRALGLSSVAEAQALADEMMRRGGYVSAENRARQHAMAAYADYGRSRAAAVETVTPPLPRGKGGLPLTGPAVPSRPVGGGDFGPSLSYQYSTYGRAAEQARRTTSGTLNADEWGRPREIDGDALRSKIDDALSSGGEKAGSSIEGAMTAGGEKAGSAFKQLMDSAAQSFGEAAARSFNSSVRVPSGGGVNANVGRTGQGGGDL